MFNDVVKVNDNSAIEINTLYRNITNSTKEVLKNALRIGELLFNKKNELGHGSFTKWVEENLDLSVKSAYNYRLAYENRARFETGEFLSVSQFFKAMGKSVNVAEMGKSVNVAEMGKSVNVAEMVDGYFEVVEMTDDDLDQKDKELFNLKTELDKIIEERKQLKKQNKALSNETTEYKKIFNDMESIKVVIRSLLALNGEDDEEKVVESLQDAASVGVYIENCKKIFFKNFTALQYLSIDPNAISCFSTDVKGLLNSVERWVKDMKKRFVIIE